MNHTINTHETNKRAAYCQHCSTGKHRVKHPAGTLVAYYEPNRKTPFYICPDCADKVTHGSDITAHRALSAATVTEPTKRGYYWVRSITLESVPHDARGYLFDAHEGKHAGTAGIVSRNTNGTYRVQLPAVTNRHEHKRFDTLQALGINLSGMVAPITVGNYNCQINAALLEQYANELFGAFKAWARSSEDYALLFGCRFDTKHPERFVQFAKSSDLTKNTVRFSHIVFKNAAQYKDAHNALHLVLDAVYSEFTRCMNYNEVMGFEFYEPMECATNASERMMRDLEKLVSWVKRGRPTGAGSFAPCYNYRYRKLGL